MGGLGVLLESLVESQMTTMPEAEEQPKSSAKFQNWNIMSSYKKNLKVHFPFYLCNVSKAFSCLYQTDFR